MHLAPEAIDKKDVSPGMFGELRQKKDVP